MVGAHDKSDDPAASVRQAIIRLQHEHQLLTNRIGTAVVTRGRAERALRDQQDVLEQAGAEIGRARAVADRAAADALAVGDPVDAALYRQAADGLQSQLDTVQLAVGQLAELRGTAELQVDRTRELLRRSRASLEDVLREQVRLLSRLERLDRERVLAEARQRSRDRRARGG